MIKVRIAAAVLGVAAIGASTLVASPALASQYDFSNTLSGYGGASSFAVQSVHVDYTSTSFTDTLNVTGTFDHSDGFSALLAFGTSAAANVNNYYVVDAEVDEHGAVTAFGANALAESSTPLAGVTAKVDGAGRVTVKVPTSAIPFTGSLWHFGALADSNYDMSYFGTLSGGSLGIGGFGPIDISARSTTTNVQVSFPFQEYGGTPATATVTVKPAVAGSVALYDGTKRIGSTAVDVTGHGSILLPQRLSSGTHKLKAVFTPSAANYRSSTSPVLPFSVHSVAKKTTTKISLSKKTQVFKKAAAKVTVTVTSKKAAGKVVFYDGKKKLKSVKLKKGKASYTLSKKLKTGTHKIKAVYVPKNVEAYKSSSKTVKLKVVR